MNRRYIVCFIVFVLVMQSLICIPVSAENVSSNRDFKVIAENTKLKLIFNSELCIFTLIDKGSGQTFSSFVDPQKYQGELASTMLKKGLNNLFVLYYSDLNKDSGQINSAAAESTKKITDIKDGVQINYIFNSINISLSIDIWLDEQGMNIKIPVNSIKEGGKYYITSIAILPLFKAANKNDTGYLFYPDGSGALSYFSSVKDPSVLKYKFDIYGEEQIDIDKLEDNKNMGVQDFMLPVFGMKNGDTAFLGIITKGECNATINIDMPGLLYNLSRIYAEFKYRRRYSYTDSQKNEIVVISKNIIKEDHSVKYIPLTGDQANYSGMANSYRNYLLSADKISKKIKVNDKIPLGLDLFMGIIEQRMLFDKYIPMTTFKQAENIIEDFLKLGISDLHVNMIGYNKDGYGKFNQHLNVSSSLGGTNGLRRFNEYVKGKNIKTTLQENYTDAATDTNNISFRNDVIYKENGMIVTNKMKNLYLLNPFKALMIFMKDLSAYKRIGSQGIAFEKIGQNPYYDLNKKSNETRQQTINEWNKLLSNTKNTLGYTAVEGGNMYVLASADKLLNIPVEDTGYFITDETIPFYQMVVHGYIPYSSNAGNLFYDNKVQKLKWIEYGSMPYYILTYNKTEELRHTSFNHLFTSQYKDWLETASDMNKEFNRRLSKLWSRTMVEHQKIADDIYCTTYDNGTKVYVNYSDFNYVINNITIKALDYVVAEGEVIN